MPESFEVEGVQPDGAFVPTPVQSTPQAPIPTGTTGGAATNENAAPAPGAGPGGQVQDDPVFQSLPREIQKKVEAGMPLDKAVQVAANAGGAETGTAPQVDQGNFGSPTPGGGPGKQAAQQAVPDVAEVFAGGPERLTAGQALEGGRSGQDTFARPGSRGFQAFSGQEFNPFLLRPEAQGVAGGAALSARDALRTGDAGRSVISSGGAEGFNLGGKDDPFLKDLIG